MSQVRINIPDLEYGKVGNKIELEIYRKLKLDKPDELDVPKMFDELSTDELEELTNEFEVSSVVITSIRAWAMKIYNIKMSGKLSDASTKYKKEIYADYHCFNIIKLSEKYRISPLMLIRFIFKIKYKDISRGKFKINKLIADNSLDSDDKCQLELAKMHDAFSSLDQTKSSSLSNLFEIDINKLLRNLGVTFETQNDLFCSQIYEEHKITPDFHITSNFLINGKKIFGKLYTEYKKEKDISDYSFEYDFSS
jgi:hypothetical protein